MKLLHIGKLACLQRYTPDIPLAHQTEQVSLPMGRSISEYLDVGADAELLVVDAIADIPAELINAMPALKLIHSEGVAFNRIDVDAADAKGVYVCNCAGMNATAVAEQAVLLMLGVLRDVAGGNKAVRQGKQIAVKEAYMADGSLQELSDCTVGLVGFGGIGQATAKLLQAFGAQVFYYQRHRADALVEVASGATWTSNLDALLAASDIVSMHVPVTPETTGMCNADFFAHMQPGSYFINIARGEVVDDVALGEALRSGKLARAGLDTLDLEPVQPDHPLLVAGPEVTEKLLLSPHIGGITGTSFAKGYRTIWENIARIQAGERPVNVVNAPRCAETRA